MKVIFVSDVPNVARVGQTKEVANGYARNYLFPRKLAVLAESGAAVALEAHLNKLVKLRAVEEAQMAELARKITGVQITLKAKVGENDKLYGSITAADIAEEISKPAGALIDKKLIVLPEAIKQAGVSDVTIRFTHEITAVIKVNVVSEDAPAEAPVKAEKKEEKPAAVKAEEPAAEPRKEKKEKKPRAEKPAREEAPAAAVKEEKAEKPAKEKKAKAEKPAAEKPAKEAAPEKTEEKKEKKARAKAKKEDAPAE